MEKQYRNFFISTIIASILISSIFGGVLGFWAGIAAVERPDLVNWMKKGALKQTGLNLSQSSAANQGTRIIDEESAVTKAVEKVSPAVVSIIVTKDLPKFENYSPFGSDFFSQFFGDEFGDFFGSGRQQQGQGGTRKTEVGGGTGFIITSDGYIVTNKHVVSDEAAEYTVLLNNEKKYPAKVLARDNATDFAVLKIEANDLTMVELGDSSELKVGQTAIAIGNALAEFRNTVSVGVISGLARSIVAGGAGFGSESLNGVIQTDASINSGNSGGPLLNSSGQVIGINTAVAQNAQGIGFAIPINEVKGMIDSVRQTGRIVKPWLGVRYVLINKEIAAANKLDVDYGALVVRGENSTDLAVVPGSPANKAGIEEGDIILEFNGKKINEGNPLAKEIGQMKPGDAVTLKVLHKGEKKDFKVKLEEAK